MDNKEPIVLGELKKEKSSKPVFAIIVFILILGVCFGLPYIENYISEDFNLVDLLGNKTTTTTTTTTTSTTTTTTTTTKVVDNTLTLLTEDAIISLDHIYLNDITIDNNTIINYTISSTSNLNLDDYNYYLQIYDENQNYLGEIKLTGSVSTASSNRSDNLDFNVSGNIYLKMIKKDSAE